MLSHRLFSNRSIATLEATLPPSSADSYTSFRTVHVKSSMRSKCSTVVYSS